jgi:hypothetical protein
MRGHWIPTADLEPAAVAGVVETGATVDSVVGQGVVAVSIAVSLKRIADTFDASARLSDSAIAVATGNAIAHSINHAIREGLSAPLNSYGEGIGEAIAGQLQRGQL